MQSFVYCFLHVAAFLLLAWSTAKFNHYWDSESVYRYVHVVLLAVFLRYDLQHVQP